MIKDEPARNSAYLALARLYYQQKKIALIEELYLTGLKEVPDNNGLRLALAEFYQLQKQYQKAVDTYEIMLKDNSDALVIKNNLAALILDHFSNPKTIARAGELAADLGATEVPAFLDTAGWVQYQQGNYPRAISLLNAAIENGGKGAIYHYHLGMAYYKGDMKAQAKQQLELALVDEEAEFVGKDEARLIYEQL